MTSVKTMQCLLLCPSACKHLHPRLDCSENLYENKTEQVETNHMDKPDSQIQQFVPPVLENRLQLTVRWNIPAGSLYANRTHHVACSLTSGSAQSLQKDSMTMLKLLNIPCLHLFVYVSWLRVPFLVL